MIGLLTVVASCAVGTAAIGAERSRPMPDHGVASSAVEELVLVDSVLLGSLESASIPRKRCPAPSPMLAGVAYHPAEGWRIPEGVEIRSSSGMRGIFVHVVGYRGDVANAGWAGGGVSTATNWSNHERRIDVVLHCVKPWTVTIETTLRVEAHRSVSGVSAQCPPEAPYLVSAGSSLPAYTGWQYVFVRGVKIEDRGFDIGDDPDLGAILRADARNVGGYQTGIAALSIIARDTAKSLTLTLFCTADRMYGARW